MRKNIFFSVLLFLSILILLLFPLTVGAAEVVDKIARFTGLSSDLTQLVLESEPELLGKLNKTVFGVQVLNQLLEAKDTEAMRSIFNLAVSNLTDYLMKQAVHPAIGTFLTVVKAYKNSLELVRDYIVIPKFDNDTYERYKKARGGVLDYRYANSTEAFEQATFAPFGGYYLLKEKRYKELIKAKGYNPELIGGKLEASLRRNIDNFWMKQMETKYIQERLKKSQDAIIKSIWKTAQSEIDLLKQRVLELGSIYTGLFIIFSKDLPEGWWHVKDKNRDENPRKSEDSDQWSQKFMISDGKGYKQDADGRYFRMVGQKKTYDLPYTSVMVLISPRFYEGQFDASASTIQSLIDVSGYQPIGKLGVACILRSASTVSMFFYRGMYCCYVNIFGMSPNPQGVMQKHVELAYHFSRIVVGKMPAIVIENPK